MKTHLSYSTYQKLCQKFGKDKIGTFAYGHVFRGYIENGIKFDEFPLINMNGILSKEFIDLLVPETDEYLPWALISNLSTQYYRGGMPAVGEYILSMI